MLPSTDDHEISPATYAILRHDPDSPEVRLVDCREEDEYAHCRIEPPPTPGLRREGSRRGEKEIPSNQ